MMDIVAALLLLLFSLQLWAVARKLDRKLDALQKNQIDRITNETALREAEKEVTRLKGAQQPSLELGEFLSDVKHHGYAFVRVDPDNILLRSPRR